MSLKYLSFAINWKSPVVTLKVKKKSFWVPVLKHQNNPNYILKLSILNSQPFKIDSRTVRVLAMDHDVKSNRAALDPDCDLPRRNMLPEISEISLLHLNRFPAFENSTILFSLHSYIESFLISFFLIIFLVARDGWIWMKWI